MFIQPIETPRLILRRFATEDWTAVFTYTADPTVMHYIPEGPMTQTQAQTWVNNNSGESAQAFPIILQQNGQIIGHIIFHAWFSHRTYEIGWVLHQAYQGQGYATEAAKAVLDYAFTGLQAHRVIATCQPENTASYRVMEKIGMRREGYFQKCIYRGENIWWDEYFYAILENEWFNRLSLK